VSRRAWKVTAAIALAFSVAGASEACRTATQVELVVTYDGKCSDLQEVAFIIGTDPNVAEGRIESNVFTTTTTHCEQGSPSRVGSLVVTPNDATGRASIIVLASFGGQPVTECKPEKGYAGCIIARRAFAFVDHTALTLEIPLEASCKNVPCDAVSTCKNAACVTSDVSCTGSGCGQPGVISDGGIEFTDAPTDPDAYVQNLDAQPPPRDAGFDGQIPTLDGDIPPMDAAFDAPPETGGEGGSCAGMGTGLSVNCNSASGLQICTPMSPVCGYSDVGVAKPDAGIIPPGYACRTTLESTPSMQNPTIACRSNMNCPANSVCCIDMSDFKVACTFPGTPCSNGAMVIQACSQTCECNTNQHCGPGPTLGTAQSQGPFGVCLAN